MPVELVSGWVEEDRNGPGRIYLVVRDGDDVKLRSAPARWSMFVKGLDQNDQHALQRSSDVLAVQDAGGGFCRIDMRNRWARKDLTFRLRDAFRGRQSSQVGGPGFEESVREADVSPLRRFLSDTGEVVISATPRVGFYDLETDSRKSFADMLAGRARILAWCLCDYDGNRVADAVLEDDTDAAERALLERFLEEARRYDVLSAWYLDGFDGPVLQNRCAALSVQARGRVPMWHRWCWLDSLETFKKYNAHAHESGEEKTSLALNNVAQTLLGEGKHDFDASKTWQAWAAGGEERDRLRRYNRQDTVLQAKIERKTGYVALHLAVAHITRVFPDTLSLQATQQGDGFLIRLGVEHGYRWATKMDRDEETRRYAGAFVMEPTRLGAIENVHVCDFASLYPAIMRSWNMSPDTLVWGGHDARTPGCAHLPDRATRFRTDTRGMLPRALDTLVAARGEYTKKMDAAEVDSPDWHHYRRLSSAFKITANSFYGIVGSPFSRFFNVDVAEGVTQTGKWLIHQVANRARMAGLDPFYGDTDSLFVTGDAARFRQVVDEANSSWSDTLAALGCTESRIKLEFEKSFRRLVLVSAKRYAGTYLMYKGKPAGADAKAEIKGLEYKRGDSLRMARDMQKETIDLLLGDTVPPTMQMHQLVDGWRERVLKGPLTLSDVTISQSVKGLDEYAERYTNAKCAGKIGTGRHAKKCAYEFGGTAVKDERGNELETKCPRCGLERKRSEPPIHVRVAKVLGERGVDVRSGIRVEYVIVQSDSSKLEGLPAADPGALERIDRDYYWSSRIYPPTARVLEAVYPNEKWTLTAAEEREIEKLEERARNRGRIDDLPLYAQPGTPEAYRAAHNVAETSDEQDERLAARGLVQAIMLGAPLQEDRERAAVLQDLAARAPVADGYAAQMEGDDLPAVATPKRKRKAARSLPVVKIRLVTERVGTLKAIRSCLAAHPGHTPVTIEIATGQAVVSIPTGMAVKPDGQLKRALERMLGSGDTVSGLAEG